MENKLSADILKLSKDVETAYERIKPFILKTPLMFSQPLSSQTGANIFLKLGKYNKSRNKTYQNLSSFQNNAKRWCFIYALEKH